MRGQNDQRTLAFTTTCRGSGRIYVMMERFSASVRTWEAAARTLRGGETPCEVVPVGDGRALLAVAVLGVAQRVRVRGLDAEGRIVASGSHVVRPMASKALSVLGGRLHGREVREMRLLGQQAQDGHVRFCDFNVVMDENDVHRLQVTLELRDDRARLDGVRVELGALRNDATPLDAGSVVVLGDETRPDGQCPGVLVRRVRYSLAISAFDVTICLWARFPEGTLPDRFYSFEPYDLRDLRMDYVAASVPAEAAGNYQDWFVARRANPATLAAQRAEQERLAVRPLFSVVVPLYHTPVPFLRDVMDGLLGQSYPRLEVVLVNSTPADDALSACVGEYAAADERVRVVTLEENLGITENTNAGIAVATGDFVSFMDHDDAIEPDLFYWYAHEVNEHPDADLLYCDEDLLVDGEYVHPFFKPDWSLAFLESNNYLCHLLTVRRSCLAELPTPTRELDGAQDHSMSLAVGERARAVCHVRRVLYHWRSHPLSTAQNADEKPESYRAGKLAIDRHLERIGFPGVAESAPDRPHCYRTVCDGVAHPPLSVVRWGVGRGEAEVAYAGPLEVLDTRRGEGETWAQAVGRAVGEATGDYVLLLSRGVASVSAELADTLVAYAQRSDVGLAAPQLQHCDTTILSLGMFATRAGELRHMGHLMAAGTINGRGYSCLLHNALVVDPACVMGRRSLLAQGVWGEGLDMQESCADLCLASWERGGAVFVVPDVWARVLMDARQLGLLPQADAARLVRCWPRLLEHDPFYSEALSEDGHFGFDGAWKWYVPMRPRDYLWYKLAY